MSSRTSCLSGEGVDEEPKFRLFSTISRQRESFQWRWHPLLWHALPLRRNKCPRSTNISTRTGSFSSKRPTSVVAASCAMDAYSISTSSKRGSFGFRKMPGIAVARGAAGRLGFEPVERTRRISAGQNVICVFSEDGAVRCPMCCCLPYMESFGARSSGERSTCATYTCSSPSLKYSTRRTISCT